MSRALPQGWAVVSLNEISQINPRHPKDLDDSISVSFAPMAALSESKPQFQFLEERPLGEVRKGFTHFAEGDVLFAKITPCMENGKGAVAIGIRNGLGCGTTELHVIRPLGEIEPYYLYRFLAQPSVRRAAKDNFTGTAGQARVPTSFIEQLEVPIAPLAEQRRIVAKLEELFSKVDACKQRLAKIPMLLKRFRQSVLAAACSGRLTSDWREQHESGNEAPSLPPGWRWSSVEELLPPGGIFDGPFGSNLKTSDYTDSGVRVVRLENIGQLRFIMEKKTFISQEKFETLVKHTVGAGDIVFASFIDEEIRACVLPCLPTKAIAKADCFCLRPIPMLVDRRYLVLQLVSRESYERLFENVHGATRPRINTTQIRKLEVRVCPLPEQQEIVRRVETFFALADQIEARLAKAQAHTDKLTESLLFIAFRGKLVPQCLTDEHASALLDRIRQINKTEKTDCRRIRRGTNIRGIIE